MWCFETDAAFQAKLDWAGDFIRGEIARLDTCYGNPFDKTDAGTMATWRTLKAQVKERGLWAPHLPRKLGGAELSRVECALLSERFAWSRWAPMVFGCHPQQSRLALAILEHGAPELASRYAQPLLECEISAAYCMNEPIVGGTRQLFTTRAVRGDTGWILNGEKWFIQNAAHAELFLVVAVTDPEADPAQGMSVFALPSGMPGVNVLRELSIAGQSLSDGLYGTYAYVELSDVRLPHDAMLGGEGAAHAVAQSASDPFDLHHAARSVGQVREAFDMLCERAVSFETRSGPQHELPLTKEAVAICKVQIEQLRLLVLRAAWAADHLGPEQAIEDVLTAKVAFPDVLHDVVRRVMHLHGVIGVSSEMPFGGWLAWAQAVAVAEGPLEVSKLALGDAVLKRTQARGREWPTGHIPTARRRWGCD